MIPNKLENQNFWVLKISVFYSAAPFQNELSANFAQNNDFLGKKSEKRPAKPSKKCY